MKKLRSDLSKAQKELVKVRNERDDNSLFRKNAEARVARLKMRCSRIQRVMEVTVDNTKKNVERDLFVKSKDVADRICRQYSLPLVKMNPSSRCSC